MNPHREDLALLVPWKIKQMPCGGTPIFDVSSGIGYICDTCFAVIGSVGQPKKCVELNKQNEEKVSSKSYKVEV